MSIHSHKQFCIGLTGNIASGKSTVSQIFKNLGAHIISADDIAKSITQTGTECYQQILNHFGPLAKNTNDNSLNRKFLRSIISYSPHEKKWLENLLHPLIRHQIETSVNLISDSYIIIEIPLLFNKNDYPYLDRVLLIVSDLKQQIERIMARDHCTQEQAKALLALQPKNEERIKIADDIVENDGDTSVLAKKIEKLHQFYLSLSK